MKTDFSSPVATAEFSKFWHIECSTFTASSFKIWNSSTGIPSPTLAWDRAKYIWSHSVESPWERDLENKQVQWQNWIAKSVTWGCKNSRRKSANGRKLLFTKLGNCMKVNKSQRKHRLCSERIRELECERTGDSKLRGVTDQNFGSDWFSKAAD